MKLKTFFFVLLFCIGIYILNSFYTPPFVAVPTKSMEPTLRVGEMVIVKKVNPNDIQKGNIVVASISDEMQTKYNYPSSIVHRVVNKVKNSNGDYYFSTKGDSNPSADPFTSSGQHIQGVVIYKIPYVGYAILFLHSKPGLIFVGIFLLLLFLDSLSKTYKNQKESIHTFWSSLFTKQVNDEIGKLREEVVMLRECVQELVEQNKELRKNEQNKNKRNNKR